MLRRNVLACLGAAVWAKAETEDARPGLYACTNGSELMIGWTTGSGNVRRIASEGPCSHPNLSPGGRFVAFDEEGSSTKATIVDLKQGVRFPIPAGKRTWSPADDALIVEANSDLLFCREKEGWRPALVAHNAAKPIFDATGSQFAYQELRENRMGPGGAPAREARLMRTWASSASPGAAMPFYAKDLVELAPLGWSPDGNWFFYLEHPAGPSGEGKATASLFRIPPVGGRGPRALALSVRREMGMWDFSSSGDYLAAVTGPGGDNTGENGGADLVVVKLTGEIGAKLVSGKGQKVCHPAWSTKGDRIAYAACRAGGADPKTAKPEDPAAVGFVQNHIWVADTTGASAPRPLTTDPRFRDEAPAWASDGRTVLFCRTDRAGKAYVGSITDRGAHLRQVSPNFEVQTDASGRIQWGRWMDLNPTPRSPKI